MKQILLDLSQPLVQIVVDEPTEIFGLFVGKGDDARKVRLEVIHNRPNLNSLTLVKAVLFDNSHFDFEGDIIINTGAKYTDSYLKAGVMMMSRHAHARAVPSLEIMENDVKGGHGATIGQVSEEELFYLTSRGLTRELATNILVQGFVRDIVEKINDEKISKLVEIELEKLPNAYEIQN